MSLYDDIDLDLTPSTAVASFTATSANSTLAQSHQQQQKTFQANASSIITATTATPSAVSKMNLSFLKTQLEAKKALLQNAAAAQVCGSFLKAIITKTPFH